MSTSVALNRRANFYFGVASSLVLIVVCILVSERVVEPRLGAYRGEIPAESREDVSPEEASGLRLALYALIASVVVFALLTFRRELRCAIRKPGDRRQLPLVRGLIVLIMLAFLAIGAA